MGRYRKMLVAIDGSEESLHALKESFKLAADEKTWITAVCVSPPYVGDLDLIAVGNIKETLHQPCREAMEDVEALAAAERVWVKPLLEEGEIHERILDVASEYSCELIVMGRRGRRKFERTLVGSTTARVIGYSDRDVLVVPLEAQIGWRNILVATDGSRHSENAVSRAIDFAASYGGELTVLSVVDVPAEFYGEAPQVVDQMAEKARGHAGKAAERAAVEQVKAEVVVREGAAHEMILEEASARMIDTIVMASHGKTGLRRLLMGSVTEQVVGFAPCPILVAKAF
jgi:nucleotide-binding universal stress UspA family protein